LQYLDQGPHEAPGGPHETPGGDQEVSATNTEQRLTPHQEVPSVKKCVQNHRRLVKTPYMPLPQVIGRYYNPPLPRLLINTGVLLPLHPPVDRERPMHKVRQGGEQRCAQHGAQGKPEKSEIMVAIRVK